MYKVHQERRKGGGIRYSKDRQRHHKSPSMRWKSSIIVRSSFSGAESDGRFRTEDQRRAHQRGEDIQDSVESVLSRAGYADVAKAYILYRKKRENLRNVESTVLDYKKVVEIISTSTTGESRKILLSPTLWAALILSNSGAITANYWLSEIYDDEIANAHRNADIHIHDLSMLTGYCAGWSLTLR